MAASFVDKFSCVSVLDYGKELYGTGVSLCSTSSIKVTSGLTNLKAIFFLLSFFPLLL